VQAARMAVGILASCIALDGARASPAGEFKACLAEVRKQARAEGITQKTWSAALEGVEPDPTVIEAMDYQPEFVAPIWDYIAGLVDGPRIANGREKLAAWEATLAQLEARFGVDRHVLVALWGVETNYGTLMGRRPLVRSLATTACFGRRQKYFREELLATLRIVQNGDVKPALLKGSWAGAFGQTQFMPSTFHRVAIDFDGDGRRDIVGSVPDALASSANYLKDAGWQPGKPWGYEVVLPAGYDGPSGRRQRATLDQWAARGIRRLDGTPVAGAERAALFVPSGVRGPAFMVFANFDAIVAYNASESYALAIAHLADRMNGAEPFRTPWPTDDPGLTRAQRRELQELLKARGFDIGEPDGIVGPRTADAVREFQRGAGLPVDGYAGARVLEALRAK
jgi:lytic murein transglycosylase